MTAKHPNIIMNSKPEEQAQVEIKPIIEWLETIHANLRGSANTETIARSILERERPLRQRIAMAEKEAEGHAKRIVDLLERLKAIRSMVSRFLIAHRDTHRSWVESFVECGAVKVDFNYHPHYPYIEPATDELTSLKTETQGGASSDGLGEVEPFNPSNV
jgi:hypothetical protein